LLPKAERRFGRNFGIAGGGRARAVQDAQPT
jgi:hypothetical protein